MLINLEKCSSGWRWHSPYSGHRYLPITLTVQECIECICDENDWECYSLQEYSYGWDLRVRCPPL